MENDCKNSFQEDQLELVYQKTVSSYFPVFKKIKIGTYKSITGLKQSLFFRGFQLGGWGDAVLNNVQLAKKEKEINLHIASVRELTGKDEETNRKINEAIVESGYNLCPAEVGPQLRLQYTDQPKGEWIRLAMEPLKDSKGSLFIFCIDHDFAGKWLCGNNGHPDNINWTGDSLFLFTSLN